MTESLASKLRTPEVARRLGITGREVYELIFSGELPGGPGADGLVYVDASDVEAYLRAQREAEQPR